MGFEPSTPDAGNTVGLRDEGGVEDEQGRKEEWVMFWLTSLFSLSRARPHACGSLLVHSLSRALSRSLARTRALSLSLSLAPELRELLDNG
jgi:hypothetical protein